MKRTWLVGDLSRLLLLALALRLLTAWALRQPGYTDAYYYAVGARQLYEGKGLSEPFLWNYLDPPAALPHPGYLYWMPLAAILGWLGMEALGPTFRGLQAPFVLLSALLPLLAYLLAWDLGGSIARSPRQRRRYALLAGLLALFPGFYAHVLVLPDNFAPFALAGALCLWAAGRGLRQGQPLWFGLAGLAAGFGHLSRADGLLLPAIVLTAALAQLWQASGGRGGARRALAGATLGLIGYLCVMAPWFARNWQVSGRALPTSGTQTLFLTDYDDMFAYGRLLTIENYLAWGWPAILQSKVQALAVNLQRLWAEAFIIVLLPFAALGLWRLRRDRLLWPFFLYLPLVFLAMTLAFTFPGMRGGLYHSAGALQVFFLAAAGPGLESTLLWAARHRHGWNLGRAWRPFSAGLVALAVLVTAFALWRSGVLNGDWNRRDWGHDEIGRWLAEQGEADALIMVGNAPAYTWHTGQPAIAIPNEPPDVIVDVARGYGARYLVLDASRPRTTDALYHGQKDHPDLALLHQVSEWQLYRIQP